MGKLIKYELRGTYKVFLMIIISLSLVNVALLTRIDHWYLETILGVITLANVGAYFVLLIFSVRNFSKEVYEDRGYLTFTLPVSGAEVVGSKLILAVIHFSILSVVAGGFQYYIADFYGKSKGAFESLIDFFNFKLVAMGIVSGAVDVIVLLILIYFSITTTKMALKNKKIGKFMGFVVFILLSIVIEYITFKIKVYIPVEVTMNILKETLMTETLGAGGDLTINIASTIFNLIVFVGMFVASSYIVEKKIDL
ncbi:hypothetical protein [Dethiothermospora halolimnae]|uniref:hypothetical protein n=1 Tax=Dethiothermospora halolimnae TaxID=3114390 RepID=UPI003CCBB1B2